jgi:hypothetical protein
MCCYLHGELMDRSRLRRIAWWHWGVREAVAKINSLTWEGDRCHLWTQAVPRLHWTDSGPIVCYGWLTRSGGIAGIRGTIGLIPLSGPRRDGYLLK